MFCMWFWRYIIFYIMAQWLSWLERRPVTAKVESSSLFWVVDWTIWGLSSAGRASALQAEGHRFEPYRPHFQSIAEWLAKKYMPMWLNWQSSWFVISRLSVRVRSSAYIMDGFPSGQRGQTVNLLSTTSKVRILPHPLTIISERQFHIAGWSSLEARRAHNPKVVGSNPTPATQ